MLFGLVVATSGLLIDQTLVYLAMRLGWADVTTHVLVPAIQSPHVWPFVILALFYAWNYQDKHQLPHYGASALLLATAGFASNLLTYSIRGGFVDYIPTGFSYINIADVMITVGVGLWLRAYLDKKSA